jgi:hypothetical protein
VSLRTAYRLLADRLDDHLAVWLIGLAFGLFLGGSYALLFVVDGPLGTPVAYAALVTLVAPLFGAALWPYVAGDPPESLRALPRLAVRGYPRLLAARLGYVALLAGFAGAFAAVAGILGTGASLLNYATGGGATTLPPDRAMTLAVGTLGVLGLVGAAVARLLFGFLDAAALDGGLRGALGEAFETALDAPGRTVAGALALAPYRVGLPVVAFVVSATAADTRGFVDAFVSSPRLAVVPAGAPSYAGPPDPSLAPVVVAGLVLANVVVTTFVWPVALGYHLTLFETLHDDAGGGGRTAPTGEGEPVGQ